MNNYIVTGNFSGSLEAIVNAENEEQAKEIFNSINMITYMNGGDPSMLGADYDSHEIRNVEATSNGDLEAEWVDEE